MRDPKATGEASEKSQVSQSVKEILPVQNNHNLLFSYAISLKIVNWNKVESLVGSKNSFFPKAFLYSSRSGQAL